MAGVFFRESGFPSANIPSRPDNPPLRNSPVGVSLRSFSRESVFQAGIFSSGSDDPTRGLWSDGLTGSSNDQTRWFGIQICHWTG